MTASNLHNFGNVSANLGTNNLCLWAVIFPPDLCASEYLWDDLSAHSYTMMWSRPVCPWGKLMFSFPRSCSFNRRALTVNSSFMGLFVFALDSVPERNLSTISASWRHFYEGTCCFCGKAPDSLLLFHSQQSTTIYNFSTLINGSAEAAWASSDSVKPKKEKWCSSYSDDGDDITFKLCQNGHMTAHLGQCSLVSALKIKLEFHSKCFICSPTFQRRICSWWHQFFLSTCSSLCIWRCAAFSSDNHITVS